MLHSPTKSHATLQPRQCIEKKEKIKVIQTIVTPFTSCDPLWPCAYTVECLLEIVLEMLCKK